jgi:hypothetical protein
VWWLLKTGDGCGVLPILGYINGQFRIVFKQRMKVKFTLEQTMKTKRGSRGAALLFL